MKDWYCIGNKYDNVVGVIQDEVIVTMDSMDVEISDNVYMGESALKQHIISTRPEVLVVHELPVGNISKYDWDILRNGEEIDVLDINGNIVYSTSAQILGIPTPIYKYSTEYIKDTMYSKQYHIFVELGLI